MGMEIDKLTSLIIEYGKLYETALKLSGLSQNKIDRMSIEWIKEKLQYVKDNPNISEIDLINHINEYNEERKLK